MESFIPKGAYKEIFWLVYPRVLATILNCPNLITQEVQNAGVPKILEITSM